jgi:hypothetical protein
MGGRAPFGKEATATRLTTAGGGLDGGTLGAVGGSQGGLLVAGQVPSLTSTGSNSISVTSTVSGIISGAIPSSFGGGANNYVPQGTTLGQITSTGSNSISVAYTNGSQAVTKTVPPGIICNYLLRVL